MAGDTMTIADVTTAAQALLASVERVIEGKRDVVELALAVLFAEGHLLIEDVPGVGKTMLAKALARSIAGTFRRIQFTPDLLPSDVTGTNVFLQDRGAFEFRPGAIFANVVLGDEINRASPKTQSALLEAMEEGQVTIDGVTYLLQVPFIVMATQNPIEMEGTYPLPEAQRDRFMARLSMGYPAASAELRMLEHHGEGDPLESLTPVTDITHVYQLTRVVRAVYAAPAVKQYIVDLVRATRESPDLTLGASPRAALHLLRASKSHAAIRAREHVLPDDVIAMTASVLTHRLITSTDAHLSHRGPEEILAGLVERIPVPGAPVRV
jgi:MoxR-like ATPase